MRLLLSSISLLRGRLIDTIYNASWGSGSNLVDFTIPPVDAITAHVGSSATITTSLSNDLDGGANAAKGKDMAFVFVNAYVFPYLIDHCIK